MELIFSDIYKLHVIKWFYNWIYLAGFFFSDNGLRFRVVRCIYAPFIREAGNFVSELEYAWLKLIIVQKKLKFWIRRRFAFSGFSFHLKPENKFILV